MRVDAEQACKCVFTYQQPSSRVTLWCVTLPRYTTEMTTSDGCERVHEGRDCTNRVRSERAMQGHALCVTSRWEIDKANTTTDSDADRHPPARTCAHAHHRHRHRRKRACATIQTNKNKSIKNKMRRWNTVKSGSQSPFSSSYNARNIHRPSSKPSSSMSMADSSLDMGQCITTARRADDDSLSPSYTVP
jgi:hypothetical protein